MYKIFPLLILVLGLLAGCASKMTGIKEDTDILSDNRQGYILFGLKTDVDIKSVYVSGPDSFYLTNQDVLKGQNFILLPVKAGEYEFKNIELNRTWRLYIDDSEESASWKVNVYPQSITYVGDFELEAKQWWRFWSSIQLANRSSSALEYLEQHFPKLLSKRGIVYGGPGEDDFFTMAFTKESK